MICSDKLLGDIAKVKCPQGILRGFTGNMRIQDWRGYNALNPDSNYRDEITIEAHPHSIKPGSKPEVRDDNLTVYVHSLEFKIKNISDTAAEKLVVMSNIPTIIYVEQNDGEELVLFPEAGAKLLNTNAYYGQLSEYVSIMCQHYHREARESYPPKIAPELLPWIGEFDGTPGPSVILNIAYVNAVGVRVVGIAYPSETVVFDQILNGTSVAAFSTSRDEVVRLTIYPDGVFDTIDIENANRVPYTLIQEGDVLNVTVTTPPEPALLSYQATAQAPSNAIRGRYTVASGTLKQVFDGVEFISNFVNEIYATGTTIDVEVFANNVSVSDITECDLTAVDGVLDLSGLTSLVEMIIDGSPNLTGYILPNSTNSYRDIRFRNTGLSGIIDWSNLTNLNNCILQFSGNPAVTGFVLPSTGGISSIIVYDTGITSLDLTPRGALTLNQLDIRRTGATVTFHTGILNNFDASEGEIGLLDMSSLSAVLTTGSSFFWFNDCNLSQAQVDYYLDIIDQKSSSGPSFRTVQFGGVNAIPSAAGLASKANLEAKGITVTVNS